MKEQIIHLEPHDDVASVRDKLGWVKVPRVLLIFPDDPSSPVLQEKLDLLIIQREATRRRAQLALITRDPIVREHARELGIACFRSVEASRRRYWRTRRARISVERHEQPIPLSPELAEAGTRLRSEPRLSPRQRRMRNLLRIGVSVTFLLLGLLLALPGATITLLPATDQVAVTITVTGDAGVTAVDTATGLIPARIVGIEVEGTERIATTGRRQVPSEKASGAALFINLIPDQVTIPAGTIIRTSAAQPVRFVTLVDVTLPGSVGSSVEVPIEALEAGFTGNLPANRINQVEGPLAARVAVTNPQPTRGGDAVEQPAVAEDDLTRVRALLLQQLQQRAYARMQTDPAVGLIETEFIPLETLNVVLINAETYDGYAGQISDSIGLTMRITVQGLAVDERQARQVVYSYMAGRIGEGFQINPTTLAFRRGEVIEVQEDGRRASFIMQGVGDVSSTIDPQAVRSIVWGRRVTTAQDRLSAELMLLELPRIETWPAFWPLMPLLPPRITVQIEAG